MGRYIITKRDNGDYQFELEADNGHIIFTSEAFSTKKNCKKGIRSVKKNALKPDMYERKLSDEKENYFVLKSKKGHVVGMSQHYKSESGFENAILSVMENAPEAVIDDQSIESRDDEEEE